MLMVLCLRDDNCGETAASIPAAPHFAAQPIEHPTRICPGQGANSPPRPLRLLEDLDDGSHVPQRASSRATCRVPDDKDGVAVCYGRKDCA